MATLTRQGTENQRIAAALFTNRRDTTSVGPINELSFRSSGRIGGTIGHEDSTTIRQNRDRPLRPVEDQAAVEFIGAVLREGISRIEGGEATRFAIKTIVGNNMVPYMERTAARSGAIVEGAIAVGSDHTLLYVGYNAAERRMSPFESRSTDMHISHKERIGISADERRAVVEQLARNGHISYRLFDNVANSIRNQDHEEIARLLRVFEYTPESAIRNVSSRDNTTIIAYGPGDRPIGIALSETHKIAVSGGRTLNLIELTDFVVSRDHSGNKVSYTMAANLLNDILARGADQGMSAIFAEANASNHIITNFSMLGGRVTGMLPNSINVILNGEAQMSSFAVMEFTRENVENSHLYSILRA